MTSPVQRLVGKSTVLGDGMTITRTLPMARRRTVGAWCFLDHFGPIEVHADHGMRVGPHPHIGLQTVTWLLEGEILHRDSLGSVQVICPGQLNLMTSGRGISHSEESPATRSPRLHGAQFWIALPDHARHGEPAFVHHDTLPACQHQGLQVTVFIGELLGLVSPANVHSPLVGAELRAADATQTALPLRPDYEHGIQVLTGRLTVDGEVLEPGTLLVLDIGRDIVSVQAEAGSCAVLVGGAPLQEELLMWWNFVGRSKQELLAACTDWNAGAAYFGDVKNYDGERLSAPMPPW
ncbi:pirin family protein [Perlucidibaca piscinae]|uniref:pirin family protein n=1 Tax=Perlucidibaca piscinae TaxID=392589 RepID=UPI0003B645AF|nr:pirin family protein [Perlucidibaca piscinae]